MTIEATDATVELKCNRQLAVGDVNALALHSPWARIDTIISSHLTTTDIIVNQRHHHHHHQERSLSKEVYKQS